MSKFQKTWLKLLKAEAKGKTKKAAKLSHEFLMLNLAMKHANGEMDK